MSFITNQVTEIKKSLGIHVEPEHKIFFTEEHNIDTITLPLLSNAGKIINTTIKYNLEGVKILLSVPEYYQDLKTLISDPTKAKVFIKKSMVQDPETNEKLVAGGITLSTNKNAYVIMLRKLFEEGKLNDIINVEEKIKELESYLTINSIPNYMPSYSCEIEGQTYQLETEKIIKFLSSHPDKETMLNTNQFFGIPTRYFAYLIKNFVDASKIVSCIILDEKTTQFISDIKTDNIIDTFTINNFEETKDAETVPLKQELVEYLFKNMPENYTTLEKAIYLYLKLTRLLTYDAEIYAEQQKQHVIEKHGGKNYVSNISPNENKDVVCFEVNLVLAHLYKQLGIPINVKYVSGIYGVGHANLTMKYENYIILVDSVMTILNSDILNTKINNTISGLTCLNNNPSTRKDFKTIMRKVYTDIQTVDPSPYSVEDSYSRWQELIEAFTNPEELDITNQIEIFANLVSESILPLTEKISYYTRIYNQLFGKYRNSYMTIVSYLKPTTDYSKPNFRQPTLVISYNDSGEVTEIKNNKYLLLIDNNWQKKSLEELQQMFDEETLGYINNHAVPGIKTPHKEIVIL